MHEFANLHCHSYYSFLDGLASPSDICDRALEIGSKYVAVTDHGHCVGHYYIYTEAKKRGLIPILGTELYLRDGKYHNSSRKGFHLTLWATTEEGLHNVWDISSKSWLHEEGKDAYTNTYVEDLGTRRKGVVCGSACLAGPLSVAAKNDDENMALYFLDMLKPIFDDFVVEIHTNNEPEQRKVNLWLMNFAKKHDLKTIYAIDSHYVRREDSELQNIMLGCNMHKHYDEDHMRMRADYYMMDEQDVRKRLEYLGDDVERCFDGVDSVLSRVVPYDFDKSHKVPKYPLPQKWIDAGKDSTDYLKYLCAKGLFRKVGGCEVFDGEEIGTIQYKGGDLKKVVPYAKEMTENEWPIIFDNGLADYFLLVSDYNKYAKEHMLVGPGRGSCTASILCYATDITEVDPMGKGLIFQRFLNEGRLDSLPDIDLDFPDKERHDVVEYCNEKYGKDHVCAVGTVGTFKIKNAFQDLARYYRIPYQESQNVSKILDVFDRNLKNPKEWHDHLDLLEDKDRTYLESMIGRFPTVFKHTSSLIGVPRQWGQHACGYVISPIELSNAMPTRLSLKTGDIVSQFDKVAIESLGFLKADFLGLRNLSSLTNAQRMVKERHGVNIDFYSLTEDDAQEGVWDLFKTGNTLGVFQLSGKNITQCAMQLLPHNIMDLSTILALYRPGVILAGMLQVFINRKTGREPVEYVVPQLEPILKETYGVIVYQEQAMSICRALAGYTPLEADHMRAIIGKKKLKEMEKEEPKFVQGCVDHSGISVQQAETIFNQIKASGSYSFNKAHSYAYAVLAFWTAWMKYNYPIEFYCSCFQTVPSEDLPRYMREARDNGIKIVMPTVTNIADDWVILDDETIAIGIGSLRGVGDKAVIKIAENAPYTDFDDFVIRSGANSGVMKSLIMAGFFREWYPNSKDLLFRYEANDTARNLFGESLQERFTEEQPAYTKKEIIENEKDLIGMPITYDPYAEVLEIVKPYKDALKNGNAINFVDYTEKFATLAMVTSFRRITTKKGKPMAFIKCESEGFELEVVAFTDIFEKMRMYLKNESYFIFGLKKQLRNDEDNYILEHFMPIKTE